MTTLRFSLNKFSLSKALLLTLLSAFGLMGLAGGANAAATLTLSSGLVATNGTTVTFTIGGGTAPYSIASAAGLSFFSAVPYVQAGSPSYGAVSITAVSVSGTTLTETLASAVPAGNLTAHSVDATCTLTDSAANTPVIVTQAAINDFSAVALPLVGTSEVNNTLLRIPSHSLDAWRAARAASSSSLTEIDVFGDSTTADSGASYSWLYRVRHDAIVAGFTNGGRGLVESGDTAARSGPDDNLSAVVSQTGFNTAPDTFDWVGAFFGSTVRGDIATSQGYGQNIRLFYTKFNNRGQFSYSVDGGTAVTVDAYATGSPDTGQIVISGLSNSLHTVALTNLGRPISPPVINGIGYGSPGATGFSSGTYYYVLTGVTATGETTPGAQASVTIPNGPRVTTLNVVNGSGFTSYKVYRSTVSGGPYALIITAAASGGTYTFFTDDNTATPGAAPPSTNTAGQDAAKQSVSVLMDYYRNAGLVWNKNAITGNTFGTWALQSSTAYNNWPYQVGMGLTHVAGSSTPDTRPPARTPKLAMCALGINNQQSGQLDTFPVSEGLYVFIKAAQSAGASPVVIIPHLDYSASPSTDAPFIAAMKNVANTAGVPWFDFNTALHNASVTLSGNPHLDQPSYNIEADSIWANLLSTNALALFRSRSQGSSRTGSRSSQ